MSSSMPWIVSLVACICLLNGVWGQSQPETSTNEAVKYSFPCQTTLSATVLLNYPGREVVVSSSCDSGDRAVVTKAFSEEIPLLNVTASKLTVEDVVFSGGRASQGGCVFARAADAVFVNSIFLDCGATLQGGGVFVGPSSSSSQSFALRLSNILFESVYLTSSFVLWPADAGSPCARQRSLPAGAGLFAEACGIPFVSIELNNITVTNSSLSLDGSQGPDASLSTSTEEVAVLGAAIAITASTSPNCSIDLQQIYIANSSMALWFKETTEPPEIAFHRLSVATGLGIATDTDWSTSSSSSESDALAIRLKEFEASAITGVGCVVDISGSTELSPFPANVEIEDFSLTDSVLFSENSVPFACGLSVAALSNGSSISVSGDVLFDGVFASTQRAPYNPNTRGSDPSSSRGSSILGVWTGTVNSGVSMSGSLFFVNCFSNVTGTLWGSETVNIVSGIQYPDDSVTLGVEFMLDGLTIDHCASFASESFLGVSTMMAFIAGASSSIFVDSTMMLFGDITVTNILGLGSDLAQMPTMVYIGIGSLWQLSPSGPTQTIGAQSMELFNSSVTVVGQFTFDNTSIIASPEFLIAPTQVVAIAIGYAGGPTNMTIQDCTLDTSLGSFVLQDTTIVALGEGTAGVSDTPVALSGVEELVQLTMGFLYPANLSSSWPFPSDMTLTNCDLYVGSLSVINSGLQIFSLSGFNQVILVGMGLTYTELSSMNITSSSIGFFGDVFLRDSYVYQRFLLARTTTQILYVVIGHSVAFLDVMSVDNSGIVFSSPLTIDACTITIGAASVNSYAQIVVTDVGLTPMAGAAAFTENFVILRASGTILVSNSHAMIEYNSAGATCQVWDVTMGSLWEAAEPIPNTLARRTAVYFVIPMTFVNNSALGGAMQANILRLFLHQGMWQLEGAGSIVRDVSFLSNSVSSVGYCNVFAQMIGTQSGHMAGLVKTVVSNITLRACRSVQAGVKPQVNQLVFMSARGTKRGSLTFSIAGMELSDCYCPNSAAVQIITEVSEFDLSLQDLYISNMTDTTFLFQIYVNPVANNVVNNTANISVKDVTSVNAEGIVLAVWGGASLVSPNMSVSISSVTMLNHANGKLLDAVLADEIAGDFGQYSIKMSDISLLSSMLDGSGGLLMSFKVAGRISTLVDVSNIVVFSCSMINVPDTNGGLVEIWSPQTLMRLSNATMRHFAMSGGYGGALIALFLFNSIGSRVEVMDTVVNDVSMDMEDGGLLHCRSSSLVLSNMVVQRLKLVRSTQVGLFRAGGTNCGIAIVNVTVAVESSDQSFDIFSIDPSLVTLGEDLTIFTSTWAINETEEAKIIPEEFKEAFNAYHSIDTAVMANSLSCPVSMEFNASSSTLLSPSLINSLISPPSSCIALGYTCQSHLIQQRVSCIHCDRGTFSTIRTTEANPNPHCIRCPIGVTCDSYEGNMNLAGGMWASPLLPMFFDVLSATNATSPPDMFEEEEELEEAAKVSTNAFSGGELSFNEFVQMCPAGYCAPAPFNSSQEPYSDRETYYSGNPYYLGRWMGYDRICSPGRTGRLCGSCKANHSAQLGAATCLPTEDCVLGSVQILILCGAAVFLVIYITYLNVRSLSPLSPLFRIATFFINVSHVLYAPPVEQSTSVVPSKGAIEVLQIVATVLAVDINFDRGSESAASADEGVTLEGICIVGLTTLDRVSLRFFLPAVLLAFFFLGLLVVYLLKLCRRKLLALKYPGRLSSGSHRSSADSYVSLKEEQEAAAILKGSDRDNVTRLFFGLFSIAVVSYSSMSTGIFQLSSCVTVPVEIGRTGDGTSIIGLENVLFYAGDVPCWSSSVGQTFGIIMGWLLVAFLPVGVVVWQASAPNSNRIVRRLTIYAEQKRTASLRPWKRVRCGSLLCCLDRRRRDVLEVRLRFLIEGAMKKEYWWWDSVLFLRRAVLSAVNAFIADLLVSRLVITFLMVLFLVSHTLACPFKCAWWNAVETLTLALMLIVSILSLFAGFVMQNRLWTTFSLNNDLAAISLTQLSLLATWLLFLSLLFVIHTVRRTIKLVQKRRARSRKDIERQIYSSTKEQPRDVSFIEEEEHGGMVVVSSKTASRNDEERDRDAIVITSRSPAMTASRAFSLNADDDDPEVIGKRLRMRRWTVLQKKDEEPSLRDRSGSMPLAPPSRKQKVSREMEVFSENRAFPSPIATVSTVAVATPTSAEIPSTPSTLSPLEREKFYSSFPQASKLALLDEH